MKQFKISKYENKFMEFLDKYMLFVVLAVGTLIAMYMRWKMIPYTNSDYTAYYEVWFWEIKNGGGFAGLKGFQGGYNYAYDFVFAILTYLPIQPLYSIKMLSIGFDLVCAVFAGLIAMDSYGNKTNRLRIFVFVYLIILFSPVVKLNSAFWSQCESIYTAFILISIYLLIKKNYMLSFFFYGIAFAFKLQAIMILPFFVMIYFLNKNFSLINYVFIPIGTFISSLPGLILTGNGVKWFFVKYFGQVNQGEYLSENFPNIYYWLSANHYDMYKSIGVCFTVSAFCLMFVFAYKKRRIALDADGMISLAMWSVLCCVYFLPNMHERYGYVAEILCIIWAVGHKKHVWYPIIMNTITLFSYFIFLFGYYLYWLQNMAVVNIVTFIMFTIYMCMNIFKQDEQVE